MIAFRESTRPEGPESAIHRATQEASALPASDERFAANSITGGVIPRAIESATTESLPLRW
jgi:hypothetical protein